MLQRAAAFGAMMDRRRRVCQFSDRPVPPELMQELVRTAGTVPSGAHKQPWTCCLESGPDLERRICEAAEQEEFESYNGRMPPGRRKDLAPLGPVWRKSFPGIAPYLVVVFERAYEVMAGGERKNQRVEESVGLARGLLLAAIQNPGPMNVLSRLLEPPENERPFLLRPVGYAAQPCEVPDIHRKTLENTLLHYP